jgi:hypothetical protein
MNSSMIGSFSVFTNVHIEEQAVRMFDCARHAANSHRIISVLTRRSNRLLDLNSYSIQKRYGNFAGDREVALSDIRGTEGRQNDFDNHFNPLTERTRFRWQSIARAFEEGQDLPPVELIQVGEMYFVRDGNHRVSVARAYGWETIRARVTVW